MPPFLDFDDRPSGLIRSGLKVTDESDGRRADPGEGSSVATTLATRIR